MSERPDVKALLAAAPELLDLARNIAGLDDHFLTTPDLALLRATLREYREQARAVLAIITSAS